MSEDREEITLAQLAELKKKKGMDFILDNVEVKGSLCVKDKDGNFKRNIEITRLENAD